MLVTLQEMKNYLRLDFDDDNVLLETMIETAERLVSDMLRTDDLGSYRKDAIVRIAIMYVAAHLYEHRDESDMDSMLLTVRALLQNERNYRAHHGF